MTKRRKPSSPEQIRQAMKEKAEREAEIGRLQAQGVTVHADPAKRIIRAQRLDVFDMLHQRPVRPGERQPLDSIQYHAVRRLEEQMAVASGALKNEQTYDRVDTTTIGQNITDTMIKARKNVEELLSRCGPVNARLLVALLEPDASILTRWRATVQRVTGETNDKAQTASIRQACENLAEAWRMRDYGRAA